MRVVVDLDGTLLSCRERHCRLMHYCAQSFSQDLNLASFWARKRQGLSNLKTLIEIGFEVDVAHSICDCWLREVEHWPWLGFDQVFAGVRETLERLRDCCIKVHVLTARRENVFLCQQLQRIGLDTLIDGLTVVRPEQEVSAAKAIQLLALDACVWIGDTESDAFAALEAGCAFVPVHGGMRSGDFWKEWIAMQPMAQNWRVCADLQEAIRGVPDLQICFTDALPSL